MRTWTVRILRLEDDSPIAGARVGIGLLFGRDGTLVVGATDEDGMCRLATDYPDEWALRVSVFADCAGRSASRLGVHGQPADAATVIRLGPGPVVRGRVTDGAGRPVAGAEVALHDSNAATVDVDGLGYDRFGLRVWPPPCLTDEDGRYVYTWWSTAWQRQPEGEGSTLRVTHARYGAVEIPDIEQRIPAVGDAVFDVRLEPGVAATTRHRMTRPAMQPEVPPPLPSPPSPPPPPLPLRLEIVAGLAGRPAGDGRAYCWQVGNPAYSFDLGIGRHRDSEPRLVPPGDYRLQVSVAGFATRVTRVQVDAAHPGPKRIRLRRGRRVVGRVTDRAGHAVAGCFVSATGVSSRASPEVQAVTGDDGRFVLSGVRAMSLVFFQAVGFCHAMRLLVRAWLPWRRRLRVRLSRGCTVRGVVRDAAGRPRRDVFVQLHSKGPGPQPCAGYSTSTDPEGRFELMHVPAGAATIYTWGCERGITCAEGEDLDLLLVSTTAAAR